ncbi:hypothetical protein, partial [Prevotellamassilia timonensis]|uniref:hypothetical protein n=1 Tax=Prevotellamassilia timonensis TaxID=1852370 RepID=UPI001F271EE3
PRAFFQKAAILFKAINRNKPFNGRAMNSPPTPPYCGTVAAALHLMNSQIRCGSCREKVFFGFCLSFIRSISEQFVFQNKIFSPLMPINCLVK